MKASSFIVVAVGVFAIGEIIAMVTDAGFEAYVVRHDRGEEAHFLNAIWTVHFARGLLNGVAAAALAAILRDHQEGVAIVYASTRRNVEKIARSLFTADTTLSQDGPGLPAGSAVGPVPTVASLASAAFRLLSTCAR